MSADKDFQKQLAKLTVPEMEKLQIKLHRQIGLTEACVKAQQTYLAELQENMKQLTFTRTIKSAETAAFTEEQRQLWEKLKDNTGNRWAIKHYPARIEYPGVMRGPDATFVISNMTYCLRIDFLRSPGGCKVSVNFSVRGLQYIRNKSCVILNGSRSFRLTGACHRAVLFFREIQKSYAPYFTEICPPVPENLAEFFMVENELLPGYRVSKDALLSLPRIS